jgi:hypothetical protein
MLALLGATSVMMLDHSLRQNIDDSLNSVARAIAESVRRPAFFGPDIEDSLQSMLDPNSQNVFQLLDPFVSRPARGAAKTITACRSALKRYAMRERAGDIRDGGTPL